MEAWVDSSAPARLWLPPVCSSADIPETASAQLIKGLHGLDPRQAYGAPKSAPSSASGTAPSRGDRVMRVISRFGQRANDRAEEAINEMKHGDTTGSVEAGIANLMQLTNLSSPVTAQQAFEHIVSGIDHVLTGGASSCRVIRKDESLSDTVPLHAVRHYKVPLPSRPTVVTVSLHRNSGAVPSLWASTTHERPNSKSYELKGKDDKIVYAHAVHAEDGEDLSAAGRRNAVPRCRELFVTVEATAGEVSYFLKVQLSSIKVVLTRGEISSQIQKMRRGWEARLHEIQREPAAREQLEERILNLQEVAADKKAKAHRGRDYTMENQSSLQDEHPQTKIIKLHTKALRRCAQEDAIARRREMLDRKRELKASEWMNRADARKAAKLELDRQRLEREQVDDVQRKWLVRLAVVAYAEKITNQFQQNREMRRYLAMQSAAALKMTQFVVRVLCGRRRHKLYTNVIRLRLSLVAFARHIRPAVVHASTSIASEFLHKHKFHRESPNLSGALARFRSRVKMIQKWWSNVRVRRFAYVSLMLPYWMEVQTAVYRAEIEKKEHVAAQDRENEEKRGVRRPSATRRPSGLPGATQLKERRPSFRPDPPQSPPSPRQPHPAMLPELPEYIVRLELYDYIREQQRTFKQRKEAWEAEADERAFKQDLAAFGLEDGEGNMSCKRPKVVYFDHAEMEVAVRAAIAKWRKGAWKEIRHNRVRLMKQPFQNWAGLLPPKPVRPKSTRSYRSSITLQSIPAVEALEEDAA